jgi:hypothetical protein
MAHASSRRQVGKDPPNNEAIKQRKAQAEGGI